jgi:tetratricopeptide (TPR) repeat protein
MVTGIEYKTRKKALSQIFFHWLFGLICSCMAAVACAGEKSIIATDSEIALLPPYCIDTEGFNYGPKGAPNQSPKAAYWESIMGPTFWALHHSCWAKVAVMRSYRSGTPANIRKASLQFAISDYKYVVKNARAGFILLPEIYTNIGDLELQLQQHKNANEAFALARKEKPDYWPAYSHWAEYLIKTGKNDEARELLKTGLEYSPQAKVLIELYRRVGGKPTEIVPKKVEQESSSSTGVPATPAVEE